MKLGLACTLCLLPYLAPAPALGQTFGVTLLPSSEVPGHGDPKGSGFAVLTFSGNALSYTLFVDGIQTPKAGYVHSGNRYTAGPPVISFGLTGTSFVGGLATGTVTTTSAVVQQVLSDPSSFYVELLTPDYPGGALRGELAPFSSSYVYFPTVAKAQGLNGTNFVTDLSLVNRALPDSGPGTPANVTLEFFASSAAGLTAPTASKTLAVAPGEQLVLKDFLGSQFGLGGDGALRVTTPRNVFVTARVFNDQVSVGAGTTGLLVPGSDVSEVAAGGVLPLLSNASPTESSSGIGYRTNVGYFNPYAGPLTATFKAIRTSDGATLGSVDRTIPGLSRVQLPIFDLISTVADADRKQQDFYVTFRTSKGSALYVYAVVVDNKTGDGVYIKAVPSLSGNDAAPAAPASLTGSWVGGGHGFALTFELTQLGDTVTGYSTVLADTGFKGTAFLSGTRTGNALSLNGNGLPGDGSKAGCVDTVLWTATVTDTNIDGLYDETGTCDGEAGGAFHLARK